MLDRRKNDDWSDRLRSAAWTALRLMFAYVLIQAGYREWQHLTLLGELRSLSAEINSVGSETFRTHLREAAARHGITLSDDDIRIALDADEKAILIDVPFRWRIDLLVTKVEGEASLHGLAARWPEGRY
jgi:hypothetical protein